MGYEAQQTGFDAEDLAIRNRVLAYKAALDVTPAAAPARDELLMQFVREVADLTAQLEQVERAFGPNDPMAEILREALASARSRRDTRRIEMGLEPEKEEDKTKKPQLTVVQPEQPRDENGSLAWMLMVMVVWDRHQEQIRAQKKQAQQLNVIS